MPSIFTKIINGEIPCHKVAEDDHHIAFLDINPNTKGHTLCVPKREVNRIFDMEEQEYLDLMQFAYKVAKVLEDTIDCDRVGVSVIGLEVPHVHVHLIPINEMRDMTFQHKVAMSSEDMAALAMEMAAKF